MAITPHVYTKLADSLGQKKIDIDSDALKVMLLSAYTVGTTQDTAQFMSDVLAVATESGAVGGYTTGGVALPGVTWTTTGHVYKLTMTALTIGTGTNASHVVVFDSTPGSNATNPVLFYWDLGGTTSVTSMTANASGLLTLTGT